MPQFALYRNLNPKTKTAIPYLLDVQSDLLADLGTRVVVPVYKRAALGIKPLTRLMPEVEIGGAKCVLMTPQLAGVAVKDLGPVVTALGQEREAIVAALDLLFTGF